MKLIVTILVALLTLMILFIYLDIKHPCVKEVSYDCYVCRDQIYGRAFVCYYYERATCYRCVERQ